MKKNEKGFSVIEILIVIVVVGLIGAAGWFVYNNKTEKPTETVVLTPLCTSSDGQITGSYSSDSDAPEDPGELNWDVTVFCSGDVLFHDDTVHAINGEYIEGQATTQQINDIVAQASKLLGEPENDKCFTGRVDSLIEDYYGKTGERFEARVVLDKDDSNVWTSCRDSNALPSKERVEFFKDLSDLVPGFPYKERLEILSRYSR